VSNIPVYSLPRERSCKICGSISPVLGSIDFNRSRKEWNNYSPAPSGVMVYYNQCKSCGFVFTCGMDEWNNSTFSEHIYNEFYSKIDGGAKERQANNAVQISQLFDSHISEISVFDYGGSDGGFASELNKYPFRKIHSYDPFYRCNDFPEGQKYNLITCYEVLEHVVNPKVIVEHMLSVAEEEAIIIFSTLIQPDDFHERGLFWWYCNPRSGHISLYSKQSLDALWNSFGFGVASFNSNLHVAYRKIPEFAKRIFS